MSADGLIVLTHKSLPDQELLLYGKYMAESTLWRTWALFKEGWHHKTESEITVQLAETAKTGIDWFDNVLDSTSCYVATTWTSVDFDNRFLILPLSALYHGISDDEKLFVALVNALPFLDEVPTRMKKKISKAIVSDPESWLEEWAPEQDPDYRFKIPFDRVLEFYGPSLK